MIRLLPIALACILSTVSFAGDKPLMKVTNFDGKFKWFKVAALPTSVTKSLSGAKSIRLDLTFPKPVRLKRDAGGNLWLTFIVADQGSDWKWHQTTGHADVPVTGDIIKAGKYSISVSLTGIPGSVLRDRQQTISLGPGASGVVSPASFTVEAIRGG